MSDYLKRAKQIIRDVMKEFEPAGQHAVSAGREMLLALRAAVDAEIALYDRATRKREAEAAPEAEPKRVEVQEEEPTS